MRYITLDDLIDYNECICDEADEDSIIINENNLLSALSVQNSYFETDEEIIAALFRSIIIGHGFQDGNKRTAVLCLLDAVSNRNDIILTDDELEDITIQIAEGKLSNPTDISKLLFGVDFMKRYIKSFNTVENKRDTTNYPYKYVLKHGIGPGTLPKDVAIGKVEDDGYYDIVYIDRPLTNEELKFYDIPPEWEIGKYVKSYKGIDNVEDDEVYADNYSRYAELATKSIEDVDGLLTDYTLYKDRLTGEYFCMFGDKELYPPDPAYADMEFETNADEAYAWFESYKGISEDDLDDAFITDIDEDEFEPYGYEEEDW